jgi:hypothetical protein
MAAETRAALKARLQGENRWDQYKNVREAHRAAGASPAEAREKAMLEFQPQSNNQPAALATNGTAPEPSPAKRRRRRRRKASRCNVPGDVRWVYANLDYEPDPREAPSGGAMAMLNWAKQNPGDFFKTFLVKLLKGEDDKPEETPAEGRTLEAWERILGDGDSQEGNTPP